MQLTQPRLTPNGNRAIATVELLLFLPLFFLLWMLLLHVASAGNAGVEAQGLARQQAWRDWNRSLATESLSEQLPQIDWKNARAASAGIRTGTGASEAESYLPAFDRTERTAVRTAFVLSQPWDHETIRFPTDSEQQPSLTLSPVASSFLLPDNANGNLAERLRDFPRQ